MDFRLAKSMIRVLAVLFIGLGLPAMLGWVAWAGEHFSFTMEGDGPTLFGAVIRAFQGVPTYQRAGYIAGLAAVVGGILLDQRAPQVARRLLEKGGGQ